MDSVHHKRAGRGDLLLTLAISALLISCAATTPATQIDWADASPQLQLPRAWHTANLLPDGNVIVIGGTNQGGQHMLTAVELVNPEDGRSLPYPPLHFSRALHTATVLTDGRVLVCGGLGGGFGGTNVELFDPTSQAWSLIDALPSARVGHSATLLRDGRVLIVGGHERNGDASTSVLLFEPDSLRWRAAESLASARKQHTATLLGDGRVLVAGGFDDNAEMLRSTEVYDPLTDTWEPAAQMARPRARHSAVMMPDGTVVVSGGGIASAGVLRSVERYDPGEDRWTFVGNLQTGRTMHTMVPLVGSDRLLVLGGSWIPAEILDLSEGTSCSGPSLPTRLLRAFAAVVLTNGDVLVVGGRSIPEDVRYASESFTELQLDAAIRLDSRGLACETGPVPTTDQQAVALMVAGEIHALGELLQEALERQDDSPSLLALAMELASLSQVDGETIAALATHLPSWMERHAAFTLLYMGRLVLSREVAVRACARGEGAACALDRALGLSGDPAQRVVQTGYFPVNATQAGLAVVEGQVGNDILTLMLDTGATYQVLDETVCNLLNIPYDRSLAVRVALPGPSESISLYPATIPSLVLGDVVVEQVVGWCAPLAFTGIDGVIDPTTLFVGHHLEIDGRDGRVRVYPPHEPLLPRDLAEPVHRTEVIMDVGDLMVRAMWEGELVWLLLDSGAFDTFLNLERMDPLTRRPIVGEGTPHVVASGARYTDYGAITSTLSLGDSPAEQVEVRIVPNTRCVGLPGRAFCRDGTIGITFLLGRRLFIDATRQTVYFTDSAHSICRIAEVRARACVATWCNAHNDARCQETQIVRIDDGGCTHGGRSLAQSFLDSTCEEILSRIQW